jgi:hypothetical protein
MVNPSDTAAADYARKQVSFIRCSVVSWQVTSDWQRKMLSKYLSHAARTKAKLQDAATSLPSEPSFEDDLLTFIVDSPDDLRSDAGTAPRFESSGHPPAPSLTSTAQASNPEALGTAIAANQPLALTLDPKLSLVPLHQLHLLPPPQLAQALLSQVLTEGIGRLYFERRPRHGQVLWSKDGVVQAAVKTLSTDQLQSIINEFKRLAHLPLLPTTQTKQADLERLYQGERVLLRLRLIAGTNGEEATLQVLRGAALKFYQQQQIKQLGEDALGVAQTLQKRISQIRDRACQPIAIESPSTRTLESLSQLLKTMEKQIDQIMQSSSTSDGKKLP